MRTRHFLAFLGGLFGLAPSFAWLLWRAYSSRRSWWMAWIVSEFHHHYPVYVCLATAGVAGCVVIGYLIGLHNDRWVEESETVLDSNAALSQQASTDSLTGLFNGRAVHERLDTEMEDSYRSSMACLLIDVDHFKRINDKYGHPFGDTVLVTIAQALKKAVRRIDAVGRLGGEEFIIVLPGTEPDRAMIIAERVRLFVQEEPIVFEGKPVRVTVSVGVAIYPGSGLRGKNSLLKAADDALYKAKRSGRNRVVLWNKEENTSGSDDKKNQAA